MMSVEARKLRLIEEFLKIRDHVLLDKIESLLESDLSKGAKASVDHFAGIWTKAEAEEVKKIIAEGCDPD